MLCVDLSGDFMLLEAPTMKHKLVLVLSDNEHDVVAEEHHIDRILDGVISYLGVKTVISLPYRRLDVDFVGRSGCNMRFYGQP